MARLGQPMKKIRICAAVAMCAAMVCAHAQRLPFTGGDGNFSGDELMRGTSATEAQCAQTSSAVWARTESGDAECIRYWASGFQPGANPRALVYLPGDQIADGRPEATYASRSPK